MEIRRTESGDIHFFDDNGDICDVIYSDKIRINMGGIPDFPPMCRCSIITELKGD